MAHINVNEKWKSQSVSKTLNLHFRSVQSLLSYFVFFSGGRDSTRLLPDTMTPERSCLRVRLFTKWNNWLWRVYLNFLDQPGRSLTRQGTSRATSTHSDSNLPRFRQLSANLTATSPVYLQELRWLASTLSNLDKSEPSYRTLLASTVVRETAIYRKIVSTRCASLLTLVRVYICSEVGLF